MDQFGFFSVLSVVLLLSNPKQCILISLLNYLPPFFPGTSDASTSTCIGLKLSRVVSVGNIQTNKQKLTYYSLSFPFIKGPSKSQGISETLLFQKVINSLKQVIIDLSVIEKIVVSPS